MSTPLLTPEQLEADRRVLLKIVRGVDLEGAHDFAGCSEEVLELLRKGTPTAMKVRGAVTGFLAAVADTAERFQNIADKKKQAQASSGGTHPHRRSPRRSRR